MDVLNTFLTLVVMLFFSGDLATRLPVHVLRASKFGEGIALKTSNHP